MDAKTQAVKQKNEEALKSKLVYAMQQWGNPYDTKPEGTFGSSATVKTEGVTINSSLLDLEFVVPFDDDMEPNEGEIIIYNLSDTTINQIKHNAKITIEAGYGTDTGLVFSGYVTKVMTKWQGADKVTTVKCLDDIESHDVESISFAEGSSASYILKSLIDRTGIPIAVFQIKRDYTYENSQTIDGDLMEAIGKYAEVCGISVYVCKGKLYARHIKEGDNLEFNLTEETGLIGSPEFFEEEITAEDFKDVITGYKVQSLLQHRITTGAIVGIKSRFVNGKYRARSGQHIFNESECLTEMEVV